MRIFVYLLYSTKKVQACNYLPSVVSGLLSLQSNSNELELVHGSLILHFNVSSIRSKKNREIASQLISFDHDNNQASNASI